MNTHTSCVSTKLQMNYKRSFNKEVSNISANNLWRILEITGTSKYSDKYLEIISVHVFSYKFMSFSVHGMYRDTSMRTIFKLCHCIGTNLYVPPFNNNHAILQDREKLKLEETLTLLFNKRNIFFALFSQLCDDAFVKYINICLKIKEILPFNVPWIFQPMDMYMFEFMCVSFQFGVI